MKIGFLIKWNKGSEFSRGNVIGDELYGESMCRALRNLSGITSAELYAPNYMPSSKLDVMIYLNDTPPIEGIARKHVAYMQNGYGVGSDRKLEEYHDMQYDGYIFISKRLLRIHQEKGFNGLFLPFGVDMNEFNPRSKNTAYDFDVSYIGNDIKGEERTMRYIFPATSYHFGLFGNWGASPNYYYQRHFYRISRGKIPQKNVPLLYSSTKINLNCTLQDCVDWDVITLRTFEVLACRGFLITDRVDSAERELAGGVVFTDGQADLIRKIDYYLERPKERSDIANFGFEYVSKKATVQARMEELYSYLGSLINFPYIPGAIKSSTMPSQNVKLKVLFVNPPVVRSANSSPENNFQLEKEGLRFGVRAGSRWPYTMPYLIDSPHYPFFMGYAASYLQKKGYEVALMDAVVERMYSYRDFFGRMAAYKPDIVVLETSTPTIDIDLWFAEKVATFAEVCLVGPHVSIYAENIIERYPFVKYILKGEYALNSLDMVQTRRAGIYEEKYIEDLDDMPFPYREQKNILNYYDPSMPTERPQLQIYASKGCPFKCIYCMWPQVMYKGTYVPRSPEKVAEEIRACIAQQGYKSIFFDDDTFNIGTERISLLCDELKKIGLPWTMMGRLDTSPQWLFDKMVDSGCVGMRFGVESFDSKVLLNIKKGLQSNQVLEVLHHISEKYPQLMIHLTMMKNLPGQTTISHQKDLSILKQLGYSENNARRSYQLASCAPFPGTELFSALEKQGKITLENWSQYDGALDTVMKELDYD